MRRAAIALSALLVTACAAVGGGWQPFEAPGVVIDRTYAPGFSIPQASGPAFELRDRWVVLVACAGGLLRADVSVAAYPLFRPGQRVIVRGVRRGGEFRGAVLAVDRLNTRDDEILRDVAEEGY